MTRLAVWFCCFNLFLIAATTAPAQSSASSISFQGALTSGNGQPLSNGNYSLTFKFYDVPTGGTAVATSNVPNVPVSGGIASTPIPVDTAWFNGQTRYLGIGINGGTELAPRVMVTAVPYAIHASSISPSGLLDAQGSLVLNNGSASARLGINTTPDALFHVQAFDQNQSTLLIQSRFFNQPAPAGVVFQFDDFDDQDHPIRGSVLINQKTEDAQYKLLSAIYKDDLVFEVQENGHIGAKSLTLGGFGSGPSDLLLNINGRTQTRVLTITGGADLAEHLSVTDTKPGDEFKVEPGMVVSIDPTGNRKFKLADEAYDRKRVGIISGGNGVQPGLVLRDEGNPAVAGDQPIALTGQVWCHADANFGPITPGDLLTTSSTPGHAMKVADDARARFAVLGQALTGLKEGRGWVQVLVGKQ